MKTVLLTGGLGFIGSHIAVELIENGYFVIIVDNLSNSKISALLGLNRITDYENRNNLNFFQYDVRDKKSLDIIFKTYNIHAVIHLAGYKSVNQSISNPLEYYNNNLISTINLLEIMKDNNCKNFIFSSSATVYGENSYPVDEESETGRNITNPYGMTKYMIEKMLEDLYKSDNSWSIVTLRYFNPVGCHPSGEIGEDPNDIPNNLFPHILRSLRENRVLKIFGNDYDTRDGTCIRDFIHVVDLANGHYKALKQMDSRGYYKYNLGTGVGVSVLELVNTFERVNNVKISYEFTDRRDGDIPIVYADVERSRIELDWVANRTVEDICRDGWKYFNCVYTIK